MAEYKQNKENAGSHLPLLMRVFEVSEGDVLEIGTGYYSTWLLHYLCHMNKRHLYSYENSQTWYERAKKMEGEYHHIFYVEDWNKLPDKGFGLVFVDQSPSNSRRVMIRKYANSDYIVAHDSEIEAQSHYHLERTLQTFKYRFDYLKLKPATTVVSNFFDVSKW